MAQPKGQRNDVGRGATQPERGIAAQLLQALLQIGVTVNILPMESGPFWEMGMESAGRITSYNVCYTKLLRNPGRRR